MRSIKRTFLSLKNSSSQIDAVQTEIAKLTRNPKNAMSAPDKTGDPKMNQDRNGSEMTRD